MNRVSKHLQIYSYSRDNSWCWRFFFDCVNLLDVKKKIFDVMFFFDWNHVIERRYQKYIYLLIDFWSSITLLLSLILLWFLTELFLSLCRDIKMMTHIFLNYDTVLYIFAKRNKRFFYLVLFLMSCCRYLLYYLFVWWRLSQYKIFKIRSHRTVYIDFRRHYVMDQKLSEVICIRR